MLKEYKQQIKGNANAKPGQSKHQIKKILKSKSAKHQNGEKIPKSKKYPPIPNLSAFILYILKICPSEWLGRAGVVSIRRQSPICNNLGSMIIKLIFFVFCLHDQAAAITPAIAMSLFYCIVPGS